jgi:hypothetical protein
MVGHERSVGRVGFFGFLREREREREKQVLQKRESKTFFPYLCVSKGRR